jgi:hypothetical protein
MDHATRRLVPAEGHGSVSRAVLDDRYPNRDATQLSPGHAYAGTVTRDADSPSTSDSDEAPPDRLSGEESDTDDDVRLDAIWDSMFDLNVLRPLLLSRGLYPDDVPSLVRYAALGLTNLCWRNSVLEDWHAGDGPLSDADMMMENARTSVIARRALVDGLDPDGDGWLLTDADHLAVMNDEPVVDLLENALIDFLQVAFDPLRPLNCGSSLAEVAGEDLEELTGHAEAQVGELLAKASEQGGGVVLAFLALKGMLGCADWFGSWRWPLKVDAFVAVLQDPDDPWWHNIPSRQYPATEMAELDIGQVRSRLLAGPQQWDTHLLRFCQRQGIGYLPIPAPT